MVIERRRQSSRAAAVLSAILKREHLTRFIWYALERASGRRELQIRTEIGVLYLVGRGHARRRVLLRRFSATTANGTL